MRTLPPLLVLLAAPVAAQELAPIRDNSFLLEEAYNQEAGVVQHIATFDRDDGGDAWAFGFTQEWPLGGERHQLSFTLPVESTEGAPGGTGLGDLGVNYRHQLVGGGGAVAFAPRLTLLLPTGDEREGRGAGAVGLQGNLPLSVDVARALTFHYNAGLTFTPSARDALGHRATTASFNLGWSAVWHALPRVNLLVEAVWMSEESVAGEGSATRDEVLLLNPGVRWAHDFAGGLQIVPGLAYTIGLGPSSEERALFVYLSVEHPFKSVRPGP